MNLSPRTAGRRGRDPLPASVWRVMRARFMRGKIGIHALAQQHALPIRVVKDHAQRERWHELRNDWITQHHLSPWALTYEDLEAAVLPLTAELVREHHDEYLRDLPVLAWLRQQVLADVEQGPATSQWSPQQWNAAAHAFATLLELTRVMLGIPQPLPARTKLRPGPDLELARQHANIPSRNPTT
jgi:hypothetical protein